METEVCDICNSALYEKPSVTVTRGLSTLIEVSRRLHDGKDDLWIHKSSVQMHTDCRKNYTREKSVLKIQSKREANAIPELTDTPLKKKMRNVSGKFDYKSLCLFCGQSCDKADDQKLPLSRRRYVKNVTTVEFKNKILVKAEERSDSRGKEVKNRLLGISCLVAEAARYHGDCLNKFCYTRTSQNFLGRAEDPSLKTAFTEICNFIEQSHERQFSFLELMDQVPIASRENISTRTLKRKLQEKYGNRLIISEIPFKGTVICFRETEEKILEESWYNARRKENEQEERLRIVETAAAVIREDIILKFYDASTYPEPGQLLKNVNEDIPISLQTLLEAICIKGKKGETDNLVRKCTVIAHNIVSLLKPRSLLSRIQLGLGVYLHKKFGSRLIIDVLSKMGICVSYREVIRYENTAVGHSKPNLEEGAFIQFVFDNADINMNTIDGKNTFHCLGGIRCVTPYTCVKDCPPMLRQTSKMQLQSPENIEIKNHRQQTAPRKITVRDLQMTNQLFLDSLMMGPADILWFFGRWLEISQIPSWSGFMEIITQNLPYETTKVQFLPFVDLPASSYDGLNSVLSFAQKKSRELKQHTFVTFDQPLYAKSRDIISSSPELMDVTVRLGGFHMLMSFLGSVGHIMAGSGIKELWSKIYAANSTDKMLTGHHFSRALRAHFLTHDALARVLLNEFNVSECTKITIRDKLERIKNRTLNILEIENFSDVLDVCKEFHVFFNSIPERGPTAKLWYLYFMMVIIMKYFVKAERMGDWKLHLNMVQHMIPIFHATGHLAYAKSSRLYLQDMRQLEETLSKEDYDRFAERGNFTIRRSSKLWAGVWSDMTIEQTLMRSMKVEGGLTHGRGVSNDTISRWIHGAPASCEVAENFEKFIGIHSEDSNQHIELSESRMTRDSQDVSTLIAWFETHPPFIERSELLALSSGIVADETINAHNSLEIGTQMMAEITGKTFQDIKLSRKKKVRPLSAMNMSVKVHNTEVPIDTNLLYQRMLSSVKTTEQLEECFKYELSPVPLSLFNESGMRKTVKSTLYSTFENANTKFDVESCIYIIDGGYLLHLVQWPREGTYQDVCDAYMKYIMHHYSNKSVIVFDGYEENAVNTKSAERQRRYAQKTSPDIIVDATAPLTIVQEKFLGNERNKSKFISLLSEEMRKNSIVNLQADDDADVLIVQTAIESSLQETSVIVGQDIDLLVLLVALAPETSNIYFLKTGKGKVPDKMYSSKEIQDENIDIKPVLLFAHAVSGCDTTSSFCHKGKNKAIHVLKKSKELRTAVRLFYEKDVCIEEIQRVGELFVLELYGAKKTNIPLHQFRFLTFNKKNRQHKKGSKAGFSSTNRRRRSATFQTCILPSTIMVRQ